MIRVCLDLNGKKKFLYRSKELLLLCEKGVIDKTRLKSNVALIFIGRWVYGENEGLIVAEIELSSETETLKDLFGWVKK
jgi:adenylate cyclase